MSEGADPDRLRSLRLAKRLALLVALCGVAGAAVLALGQRPAPDDRPRPPDAPTAEDAPWARAPSRVPAPPPPGRSEAPEVPRGPRRRVAVRVLAEGEPVRGVFLRAIRHDPAGSTATELSPPVRTDAQGVGVLQVEDPPPPGAWLEMAIADDLGARHGFVALDLVLGEGVEPVPVPLPAGGSLKVEVRGLPAGARPRRAHVRLQAPYGEFLGLFGDAPVLPATDGGPTERRALPTEFRVALDENGEGTLPHVPDTFAVAVSVDDVPEGWVVEEVGCSVPAVAATEGSVLRVPAGTSCTYTLHWRALPAARIRVVTEDGRPVPGARVAVGPTQADGRGRVSPVLATADAEGWASVTLWRGSQLPAWSPEGFAVVASAPGRVARVETLAGGRWYGVEAVVALPPSVGGSFHVSGTLSFEGGRPATGVPVTLASAEPWNGPRAIDPFETVTGEDGGWSFDVPEDVRAVFAHGGGLRLHVDGDRLENGPDDALWRTKWPSLPRAATSPASFPLPPPGGRGRADLVIALPR